MAQYVHVEIEMEPGAGMSGSLSHHPKAEEHDGKLVMHSTADTTSDAISNVLKMIHDAGDFIDGPVTITARKERQIGGDDGVVFIHHPEKGMGWKITAPRPERSAE